MTMQSVSPRRGQERRKALPRRRETRIDMSKRKSDTTEERGRVYFAEEGGPFGWMKNVLLNDAFHFQDN